MMTEIVLAAPACMIAVGMGDHSLVHTLPGINVESPGRAVQSFVRKFNQRHAGKNAISMPAGRKVQGFTSSQVHELVAFRRSVVYIYVWLHSKDLKRSLLGKKHKV